MRIVAIIATHDSGGFIVPCLEHLFRNGVDFYVIDNGSTDGTPEQVARFEGRGLVGIEQFPRLGRFRWADILKRKERLAQELDADWFIHLDPDEFRCPPPWAATLAGAIAEVDRRGFNAVNFMEYVFIPTRESPDHDHLHFQETMRWYYPFAPRPAFRRTAWRKQAARVDIASSAGHFVEFPGLNLFPESFPMRHYLFLSRAHAEKKYGHRIYDPCEVSRGWHGWRARLRGGTLALPRRGDLREYRDDASLDASDPKSEHLFEKSFAFGIALSGPEWRIDEIRSLRRDDVSRIETDLAGETLWFESGDADLKPAFEAIAGLLLLPALECGANIGTSSPLDVDWLGGTERVISVMREWWDYPGRNPVMAGPTRAAEPRLSKIGACFTCGVDSFYTLLHSPHQIDTLVFVRGFDMPLNDHARADDALRSMRTIAAATGKKLVVISTNVRTHPVTGGTAWLRLNGAALAAVGHMMGREIGTFVIPSSENPEPHMARGSHWRLDGHFSSSSLRIIHDEPHVRRFQKVAAIAGEPLVRRHLRVCREKTAPAGNCSACEKCIRTMVDLCAARALSGVRTFDQHPPLAERIDALAEVPAHILPFWKNSLTQQLPREIRSAAVRLMARSGLEMGGEPAAENSNDWKMAERFFQRLEKPA